MTLAWMKDLLFKGSVDEIDVGKLRFDMPVEITIGALPGDTFTGRLTRVSPKARINEGATVFDVEVELDPLKEGTYLRAGYSATADVIIRKKENIILIPERLVKMSDSASTVEIMDSLGAIATFDVKTGLSDGLNIEITEGVSVGDKIVQRPPRKVGEKQESD